MTIDKRLTKPVRAKLARVRDLPLELMKVAEIRQCELGDYEPGIYFLVRNREVVYVGQSKTPRARIAAHLAEGTKEFDDVFIRHCAPEDLDILESFFIQAIQPIYNYTMANGEKLSPKSKVEIAQIIGAFEAGRVAPTSPSSDQASPAVVITLSPDTGNPTLSLQPTLPVGGLNRAGLVRFPKLSALGVPYGRSSIWQMVKTGEFPKPIKLGANMTVWRIGDVLDWLEDKARQASASKEGTQFLTTDRTTEPISSPTQAIAERPHKAT